MFIFCKFLLVRAFKFYMIIIIIWLQCNLVNLAWKTEKNFHSGLRQWVVWVVDKRKWDKNDITWLLVLSIAITIVPLMWNNFIVLPIISDNSSAVSLLSSLQQRCNGVHTEPLVNLTFGKDYLTAGSRGWSMPCTCITAALHQAYGILSTEQNWKAQYPPAWNELQRWPENWSFWSRIFTRPF